MTSTEKPVTVDETVEERRLRTKLRSLDRCFWVVDQFEEAERLLDERLLEWMWADFTSESDDSPFADSEEDAEVFDAVEEAFDTGSAAPVEAIRDALARELCCEECRGAKIFFANNARAHCLTPLIRQYVDDPVSMGPPPEP